MIVAVLGGTGAEGRGLARRLAQSGMEVVIGSRQEEKARLTAEGLAREYGYQVTGATNEAAAAQAHLIVLCVPFSAHRATLTALSTLVEDKIVIDVAVPLAAGAPTRYAPPPAGSALAEAQELLGRTCGVVGAFQTVSAHDMDSGLPLEADVLITGDDADAKKVVLEIVKLMGARGVDMGGLAEAPSVEALTPLLIGMNKRYRKRGIGIRFVGL